MENQLYVRDRFLVICWFFMHILARMDDLHCLTFSVTVTISFQNSLIKETVGTLLAFCCTVTGTTKQSQKALCQCNKNQIRMVAETLHWRQNNKKILLVPTIFPCCDWVAKVIGKNLQIKAFPNAFYWYQLLEYCWFLVGGPYKYFSQHFVQMIKVAQKC